MPFISLRFIISLSKERLAGSDFFYDYSYLISATRFALYLPLCCFFLILSIPTIHILYSRLLTCAALFIQFSVHVSVFWILDFSEFAPFYFNISYFDFGFFTSSFGYMIDSTSVFFYLFVPLLLLLCVLSSWYITHRAKLFLALLLAMDYTLLNVFLSFDYLHYIIFVELSIIPMFFLIFVWGSRTRSAYSGYVYVLVSLLSSIFFITAVVVLIYSTGSTSLFYFYGIDLTSYFIPGCGYGVARPDPAPIFFDSRTQLIVFALLFVSLSMKMPVFPFHIWLPEAHGEASTVGSVVLAGLFLKMAGFGMFRYLLPFFPDAYHYFKPAGFVVGLLGLLYCSVILFRQLDLKKFIAYSSVVHMNLTVVAIFTSSQVAILGAYFSMLVHSVVASLLFFLAGLIYDRYHTRMIPSLATLSSRTPVLATFLYTALLANVGFPLTANFVAEACMLLGIFQASPIAAILCSVGVAIIAISHFYLIGRFLLYRDSAYYGLFDKGGSSGRATGADRPNWDGSYKDFFHLTPLFFLVFHMFFSAGFYFANFVPAMTAFILL